MTTPRLLRPLAVLLLVPALLALVAPPTADHGVMVPVPEDITALHLPLSDELRQAMVSRSYKRATELVLRIQSSDLAGHQVGDLAFLKSWLLIRAGRAQEAITLIEVVRAAEHVPEDYKQLTLAELLLADGRQTEATQALALIGEDSRLHTRAQLVRAAALRKLGQTKAARDIYEGLIARPDPAPGSEVALSVLARLAGSQTDASYPYDRRLWAAYPRTSEGKAAATRLQSYGGFPTWAEVGMRGDRLMAASRWDAAIELMGPKAGEVQAASPEACRFWYAYGRSLFKVNRVTEAAAVLEPAGEECVGHDDDRGAKSFYIAGKSLERKKAWASAAKAYARIPALYPDHSYADDGYAMAGIAQQEAGDPVAAVATWTLQVRTYPEGDLAGEGYWRLAWGSWLAGDTEAAIAWADEATIKVPVTVAPNHARAARYWAARWRVWPHVDDSARMDATDEDRALAIRRFETLVREHPYSVYAAWAHARLEQLDSARAAALPVVPPEATGQWSVRQEWMDEPGVARGLQLAQLGLYPEAIVEFEAVGMENMSPAEAAQVTRIRWAWGDWLLGHGFYRDYLRRWPAEAMGEQTEDILFLAYPEKYWEQVSKATKDYSWDARIFHSIVREESNFNRTIVSHAGARGLSQLMPTTAKGVARWMNRTVSTQQLFDPQTNLDIGSRYFQSLLERYGNNPQLAMAGYNAGEGNVDSWLDRFGNVPIDHFVESIPFRETRHYTKRVSGTWITYHRLYDAPGQVVDLSPFMDKAVP